MDIYLFIFLHKKKIIYVLHFIHNISNKMSSKCLWFMVFTHSYTDNKKNVQSLALFHTISGPFYMGTILQWTYTRGDHSIICNKGWLLSELFSSAYGEIACKIPTPPYPSGDSSLNIALNMLARTTQRPTISSCRLGCWTLFFWWNSNNVAHFCRLGQKNNNGMTTDTHEATKMPSYCTAVKQEHLQSIIIPLRDTVPALVCPGFLLLTELWRSCMGL